MQLTVHGTVHLGPFFAASAAWQKLPTEQGTSFALLLPQILRVAPSIPGALRAGPLPSTGTGMNQKGELSSRDPPPIETDPQGLGWGLSTVILPQQPPAKMLGVGYMQR